MNAELWVRLESGGPRERLAAARELGRGGEPSDVARLLQRRAIERDSWVLRALDHSIESLRRRGVVATTAIWESPVVADEVDELRASITQRVSRTLIHETRPLAADIVWAGRDALQKGFTGSPLERSISRLNEFLDVLHLLSDASKTPTFEEIDLSALILDHSNEKGYLSDQVQAVRQDPVIVFGDIRLIRLALDNVLRNALEATVGEGKPVVINCGSSRGEAWIVVLDEGEGLPDDFPNAFDPGTTTKRKDQHFGLGLAIADQAVQSLGGGLRLSPREGPGTSCEIRWRERGTHVENPARGG